MFSRAVKFLQSDSFGFIGLVFETSVGDTCLHDGTVEVDGGPCAAVFAFQQLRALDLKDTVINVEENCCQPLA